jgi:hypothetical protein
VKVPAVQALNGVFTVMGADGKTPQQVDLGTLLMMLNLDRTKSLDSQIAVQLAEIKERNTLIQDLTDLLSDMRQRKAADNKGVDGLFSRDGTAPSGTKYSELWAKHAGTDWSSKPKDAKKDEKDAAWDANINAIKGKIDMLNNDSQMDNIKLQNLLEKRGNAFEMATKVMDTNNQSIQSILRNL